ncbi:hypothetical protein GK047_14225 [Paenibacillus sp. SYP-B3998]|uniref:Uncharacterized protein n=1 Tax=Paenibacillus sp. SYP-B3998 TaxID=2678564 RepID=A0A6G4A012_9BACL|nr:hypothetical protein [Paenibacillus sp. SYP-B3998]NEW07161.1 hypothetical protein [Paenibacillus sp. SYP-B3998]
MINIDMVFCVQCNSILAKGKADKIFKTGYYKTTIPLGHCKECACAKRQEFGIEVIPSVQDCRTEYVTPVALFA